MRNVLLTAVFVFCLLTLGAAQTVTPFNAKVGLWEVTVTHSMSGMPSMPSVPPDALAKMPPDQRARVEAMMTGKPSTDVRKECVTKEKLEKHTAFSNNRGECSYNVVNSTASKLEVKFHCEDKQYSADGTSKMEALSSDSVKGTTHVVTNPKNGQGMTMDFTISSKYLGADCGDVK